MIELRKVADLELSAASGMVQSGPHILVVADDETALDVYRSTTGERVDRIPLLDRELPADPAARKAAKPDFEAVTWLPGGLLLVLGSGSTVVRQTGVLLQPPELAGGRPREPRAVDLAPLYEALRSQFPELNIEGAAAAGGVLRLLQRGGRGRANAVIDLDLDATVRALLTGRSLPADLVRSTHVVSLGSLDGVALGFTDASPIVPSSSRIAFSAAAEDTDNPYDDGPCVGSVVGVLEPDGRVGFVRRLQGRCKVEGLVTWPARDAAPAGMLLVADPDDPAQRAPLFEAALPGL